MLYKNKRTGKLFRLIEIKPGTVVLEHAETRRVVEIRKPAFRYYLVPTNRPASSRYVCPTCEQIINGPADLQLTCETCETVMQEQTELEKT